MMRHLFRLITTSYFSSRIQCILTDCSAIQPTVRAGHWTVRGLLVGQPTCTQYCQKMLTTIILTVTTQRVSRLKNIVNLCSQVN
jgi:hypothetical protein